MCSKECVVAQFLPQTQQILHSPVTVLLLTLWGRFRERATIGLLQGSCKFLDALLQLLIGHTVGQSSASTHSPSMGGDTAVQQCLLSCLCCCLRCYQAQSSSAESLLGSVCALFPHRALIHQRHSCHALFDACFPG